MILGFGKIFRRGIRNSWVEKTKRYKKIEKSLEEELERQMEELGYNKYGCGRCHLYWRLKKKL